MTLWSGRFDTEPDPAAFDFGISFGFDRALFEDDVTGSLAWAEALGAAGVLEKPDAAAIRKGLEEILEEGRRDPAYVNGPDEDVHSFVERKLVERIGDAGRRLRQPRMGGSARRGRCARVAGRCRYPERPRRDTG